MPIHVIAVTSHNNPPPTFLAQTLRVTNGVPTNTNRSLYHTSPPPSPWRQTIARKVLGRTVVLCVPGCTG